MGARWIAVALALAGCTTAEISTCAEACAKGGGHMAAYAPGGVKWSGGYCEPSCTCAYPEAHHAP